MRFPLDDQDYKSWGVAASDALILSRGTTLQTIKTLIFYGNLIDSMLPIDGGLIAALQAVCLNQAQFYLTDRGKCVQIMGKSVSKLRGVEKIRNALGYRKDEIAVFGDDANDFEMLSEYPFSVAMGNAEPEIQAAAKYVTSGNDCDGVHEAIKNFLKLL